MLRHLLFCLLPLSPLCAEWGADSQPTRTTSDHTRRIIGYVTQWDAWKSTDAGLPKQGFLNHLNLDYSQYTHLNFSFFGVANDGSLHSGDYRNPSIHQPGAIQQPAPEDHANFLTLITELRAAIGSGKEITSAMAAAPVKLAGFDWPAVAAVLDSVNLMSYDFEGGWSDAAGHNAPLFPDQEEGLACLTSVEYIIGRGVPRAKIAMGLGFYGRGVICNGPASLGAPTVKVARTVQPDGPIITAADFASWEPFDATPTYQRITQLMGDGWTRHWDDVAKAPYLTKGSSFLSYDDSRSIGHKAAYVRDQNLGGVIVWHAFGDLRAGAITNPSDKLPFSPATAAPLINVVNSVLAGDAIPADGVEGPAPAGGPSRGLPTLPSRPLVFGYINALRGAAGQDQVIADLPAALGAANLEAFDVLIASFAEPMADGTIGTGLGAFSSYLPAVVAEGHALGKSVVVSIGGAFPASLATRFATIAASPSLRQTFSENVVAFLDEHNLDGVDIDYEFPADAAARANFTLLMETLHATVKAADTRYIVMFGGGPGWYLGSFDFAALHPHCDFFFYFGYDWKNPANGPMRRPGSVQWTLANDTLPEASVKGGIDYVLGKGFPADKIVCGLPFYGSNNRSWSAVRNLWAADPAAYVPDADSLEVLIDGEWFTPPDAMKRKMDAVLSPEESVLAGGAVIRGVGCWEIGHEHASHPDLSNAFAEWISGGSGDPVDPPLDPEAGWTSHAAAGGLTLTLQVTDDWGGGFEGQLLLHNQTGSSLSGWTIQFDAPFTVNSIWDGVYGGKSGGTHTVSNPTWGGYSLPDGSTGAIGFTGSGTKSQPINLRLNGNPVDSSGRSFAVWAVDLGVPADSHAIDPDGDGRANLIEFLNGTNPKEGDSGGLRHEIRSLTVGGVTADYFCLVVPADTASADVEYRVIAADTPAMNPARLMVLHETTDTVPGKLEAVWRDKMPLGQRGFVRLEARVK